MKGRRRAVALLAAVLFGAGAAAAELTPAQDARYRALTNELRCLVCQNQAIAESNAPLAADLREQVRSQIVAGRSDDEIVEFVTARYGDFVLYRPPFKGSTWVLWIGPFAGLLCAGLVAAAFIRRSRRAGAKVAPAEEIAAPEEVSGASSRRLPPLVLATAALGVLLFAGGWYFLAGSWRTQALVRLAASDPAAAQELAFADMFERLREYVAEHPDDAEAWAWLGRAYLRRERFADAATALARANELTGNREADLLVEEAEALSRAQGLDAALPKFEQALALAPAHPRALWFAGLAALHAGNERAALAHWEQLATQEMPDEVRAPLEQSVAELRQRTGIKAPPAAARPTLRVQVGVAPELAAEAQAGGTLFVYAQAPDSRAPLAVRRFEDVDFPFSTTLDDSHSMMPSRKLSSAGRYRLVARLSRSGNASPQSGDLEGELLISPDGAKAPHNLTIDRRRP